MFLTKTRIFATLPFSASYYNLQLKFALIELENQTELDLLKTAISFLEEQFNKLS